jgi:hypothetical protein
MNFISRNSGVSAVQNTKVKRSELQVEVLHLNTVK